MGHVIAQIMRVVWVFLFMVVQGSGVSVIVVLKVMASFKVHVAGKLQVVALQTTFPGAAKEVQELAYSLEGLLLELPYWLLLLSSASLPVAGPLLCATG